MDNDAILVHRPHVLTGYRHHATKAERAFQESISGVAERRVTKAPEANLLVRLAATRPGKLVATHTAKAVAGGIIGAGVMLTLTGSGATVGIPMIVAGAALFGVSLMLSMAARDHSESAVLHVFKSFLFMSGGGVAGALLGPGAGVLLTPSLIAIPVAGVLTAGSSALADTFHYLDDKQAKLGRKCGAGHG